MAQTRIPVTPAVRFLRAKGVDFKPFLYTYVDHGGARQAAAALSIPVAQVVKTLVMETQDRSLLIVLMHGGQVVSTRQLARLIEAKGVQPVVPQRALKATGYRVGGISPFGTRQVIPVYVQRSILDEDTIFINGGKRGFILAIAPAILVDHLGAVTVDVARRPP